MEGSFSRGFTVSEIEGTKQIYSLFSFSVGKIVKYDAMRPVDIFSSNKNSIQKQNYCQILVKCSWLV